MNYDKYYDEAKKIRIKHSILLLEELLLLNCKYYSTLNKKVNPLNVYNEMQNTINLAGSEKDELINKCVLKLTQKGYIIEDDDGHIYLNNKV